MLLAPEFDGGKGGQAGTNGIGGNGGRGGSGGSSYSWSDTDYYTTTDSDGNTTTHSNTTYYSNPGGSDGSNGRSGSDGSAPVRDGSAISTQLGLLNGDMADHVLLMDSSGLPLSWDKGFLAEIANLAPGQKKTVEGIVGVLPSAPGYSRADLGTTLNLGKIEAPGEMARIQKMTFPVRVAKAYEPVNDAEILLVTNHETTTAEVAAWEAAAKAKGQKVAIWDVSKVAYEVEKLEKLAAGPRKEGNLSPRDAANLTIFANVGAGQVKLDTSHTFERTLPEGDWSGIRVA